MRVLLGNDGDGSAGGVQSYVDAIGHALHERGHEVALLNAERQREEATRPAWAAQEFCVRTEGHASVFDRVRAWRADVCYSQNMGYLDVERSLLAAGPVVKMLHAYAGTCISGQKMHARPQPTACGRQFGASCLMLYHARGCGGKSIGVMLSQYANARAQQQLFNEYAAIVVGSEHMRRELVKNGAPADRTATISLFAPPERNGAAARVLPPEPQVLFVGRMVVTKGGDVLIRAIAHAQALLGRSISLTLCGDGPCRADWQRLAAALGVHAQFTGWVDADQRDHLCRDASVLALPSVWPEPFGLVGLEAASQGVPAVAFDVGGVSQWLEHGRNGVLVTRAARPDIAFGNALAQLLSDPAELERLGLGARAIAGELNVARHADAVEAILRRSRRAS